MLAGGATQIAGIGFFADPDECTDSEGNGSAFAQRITGDLDGCLYVFVETAACSPSGTYRETGNEIFVGQYNGETGTFRTTYKFEAKYQDCPNLGEKSLDVVNIRLPRVAAQECSRVSLGGLTSKTTSQRATFLIEVTCGSEVQSSSVARMRRRRIRDRYDGPDVGWNAGEYGRRQAVQERAVSVASKGLPE